MDSLIIWKSLIIFLFTMYFFWIIFYSFQPSFLNSDDKIDPVSGTRGYDGSDALLSDRGRTTIFLFSLIPSRVFYISIHRLFDYFVNPVTIVCSPKAKKLGNAILLRNKLF